MKLLCYRSVKYFALMVVQWMILECWYTESSFPPKRLIGCKIKPVFHQPFVVGVVSTIGGSGSPGGVVKARGTV